MANSIQVTFSLRYLDGDSQQRFSIPGLNVTQSVTSNLYCLATQNIGTTYEALDIGTVASDGGAAYFYNRDTTNFVEIGLDISSAFVAFVKIPPGCVAFFPGASDKDLYARANTAAVDLEYGIWAP